MTDGRKDETQGVHGMRVKVLQDYFYEVFRIGGIYEARRARNDRGWMVRDDGGQWLYVAEREVEVVTLTLVPTNDTDDRSGEVK